VAVTKEKIEVVVTYVIEYDDKRSRREAMKELKKVPYGVIGGRYRVARLKVVKILKK
jgi:hypothetical protein